jgi:hypothetical protein
MRFLYSILVVLILVGVYMSQQNNNTFILETSLSNDLLPQEVVFSSKKEVNEKQASVEIPPPSFVFDRDKIMDVSRLLEQCTEELHIKKLATKALKGKINFTLENSISIEDLPSILIFLGSHKILNTQSMAQLYESALHKNWDKIAPVKTPSKIESNTDDMNFLYSYNEFGGLLSLDNVGDIQAWLSKHHDLLDKRLQIKKGTIKHYISINELAAQYLDKVSDSTRIFLLRSIIFDGKSVETAIRAGVAGTSLKGLLSAISDKNEIYIQENGRAGNILSSALLYGDTTTLESILALKSLKNNPLVAPPSNQFLQKISKNGELTVADREKLLLLIGQGLGPVQWVNKHTRNTEFQGLGNFVVEPKLFAEISILGLQSTFLQEWEAPANINEGMLSLKALVDELRTNYVSEKGLQEDCDLLSKKQIELEPPFKNNRDYLEIVEGEKNNKEKLAKLTGISATLVDLFTQKLISEHDRSELEKVDEWMQSTTKTSELMKKGDFAMPHQQSYLASKICEQYGDKELISVVQRGWFVNLTSSDFDVCRVQYGEDFTNLMSNYEQMENKTPSAIYSFVKDLQYNKVSDAILKGDISFNGFKGGRDALALLMDRMIPFRATVNSETFSLFELLLSKIELNDVHFYQLNRLQLKYPNYYDDLAIRYPNLNEAGSYHVSNYTSFL